MLDVYLSSQALLHGMMLSKENGITPAKIVRDISLDARGPLGMETLRAIFPSLLEDRVMISGPSLIPYAVDVMAEGVGPLIETCAAEESKSPKSVRELFLRSQNHFGRSARDRYDEWRKHSKELWEAHRLKDAFVAIVSDRSLPQE